LVRKLLAFHEAVASPQKSAEDAKAAHAALMRELEAFELTVARGHDLCATYQTERAHFATLAAERRSRADELKRKLGAARAELEREKAASGNRAECNAVCASLGPRTVEQLEQDIAGLGEAIRRLHQEAGETQAKIDARTKQYRLLLQAVALITAEEHTQKANTDVAMTEQK
jgi:hypothetical protein